MMKNAVYDSLDISAEREAKSLYIMNEKQRSKLTKQEILQNLKKLTPEQCAILATMIKNHHARCRADFTLNPKRIRIESLCVELEIMSIHDFRIAKRS
jgi:hypothetical protein